MSSGELIIEDAPSLERLLQLETRSGLNASVISALKLETLGYFSEFGYNSKRVFGTRVFQLQLAFTTVVCNIKIVAISIYLNLDMVINLLRCFTCLEKLYIQSYVTVGKNLWRRKHRDLIRCLDIRLKKVVLKNYRGAKSQVNFASFFALNAKMLEVMRFEGGEYNENAMFIANSEGHFSWRKGRPGCSVLLYNRPQMPPLSYSYQACQ